MQIMMEDIVTKQYNVNLFCYFRHKG